MNKGYNNLFYNYLSCITSIFISSLLLFVFNIYCAATEVSPSSPGGTRRYKQLNLIYSYQINSKKVKMQEIGIYTLIQNHFHLYDYQILVVGYNFWEHELTL